MPVISKITGAPFRFWCQKVLPAVYDDSLSYYELLCKVVDYLNKVMEDDINVVNLVNQNEEDYNTLKNYVDTYFDNLNVQNEIDHKLDEMATDGSLLVVIQPYLEPVVADLNELFDEYKTEVNASLGEMQGDIADFITDTNVTVANQNDAITGQNNAIDLIDARMDAFIDAHSGMLTFTELYSTTESLGAHNVNETFELSDDYTDYPELDIYWSYSGVQRCQRVKTSDILATGVELSFYADSTVDASNPAPMFFPFMKIVNGNTAHTQLKIDSAYSERWSGAEGDNATRSVPTNSADYSAGSIIKVVGVSYIESAELNDIRVGWDGTTYNTAGDAVREQVEGLYDKVPNYALTIDEFGDPWSITSYSATINKHQNVYNITGTRTSTYRYYTLIGDSCIVSTGTGIDTLPDSAWAYLTDKLLPNKNYIMRVKVTGNANASIGSLRIIQKTSEITTTLGYVNEMSLATKDLYSFPFKTTSNAQYCVAMQLKSGTYTGSEFMIWFEFDTTYIEDALNGYLTNISPDPKTWTNGYYTNTGGYGSPTTAVEKRSTKYIPTNGAKYLILQVQVKTELLGQQYYMLCWYDENKDFISRPAADMTYGVEVGENTINSTRLQIPPTAKYFRPSFRTYGDTDFNVGFYLSDCFISPSYYPTEIPRNINAEVTNLEDRVTVIEAQSAVNKIKPHIPVKSINHRGWHTCPENTLIAYKYSKLNGFEYGECDVRFTSDNIPVLLHDASINRTARNADGTQISGTINISTITYEEALQYDFGIYKGAAYAGTKIPTLQEFLELCRNIGLKPYVEIESGFSEAKHAIIAQIAIESGIQEDITWISADNTAITRMIGHFPNGRFGTIPWTYSADTLSFAISKFNGKAEIFIDMNVSQLTNEVVEACASYNVPIELWTVSQSQIENVSSYVSGFTSNNAVASKVLYNKEMAEL